MTWSGRDNGDLERQLRKQRPEPRPEFVDNLINRLELRRSPVRVPRARLALVLALTGALAAAVSYAGAYEHAASSSREVVNALTRMAKTQPARLFIHNSPAQDEYEVKCNSGRGNLSETENGIRQTDSNTLINPHEGGTGPGEQPTDDCDPGNSGPHNSGGD
jgi:hypothetical protein